LVYILNQISLLHFPSHSLNLDNIARLEAKFYEFKCRVWRFRIGCKK